MKLYGGKSNGKPRPVKADGEKHTAQIKRTEPAKVPAAPPPKKKAKKKGKGRRIAAVTLGVIALLTVTGMALWNAFVVPPPVGPVNTPPPATTKPGTETPKPTETVEATPEGNDTSGRKKGVWTFLIVGKDQGNGNTDTMLVGMLDTVNESLDVVSIPRDTLVNVSWGVKKVNSIYASTGGITGLIDGLQDLIGYEVDCYAEVDLRAFERLVDAIGGVYYDVPRNMDYDDPTQDLHIHIQKGYQWLNGEDALKVVRFRDGNHGSGYANGDIGRIDTQQDFLKSVAKQMLTLGNIPNLNEFAKIYEENVETNLTAGNIVWFAKEFLKLDSESVRFHVLPGDYGFSVRGLSYVSINLSEWTGMVNEFINPYKAEITTEHLNILTKDASGKLYATNGTIAGGTNSFYTHPDYHASSGNSQTTTTPPPATTPPATTPPAEETPPPVEETPPQPENTSGLFAA